MATIQIPSAIPPTKIEKFLGLNENIDSEYGLKLGEAVKQIGFRVTTGGQLKRMEGYKHIFTGLTGNVQGMWYGKLGGTNFFLFANNGHLWKGNLTDGTKTDLGTLTDAPTRFIPFGSKVYILNGHEYKSFDGTTFATVAGYRPLIAITTPPAGGGTLYEQINVLTGAKHQTFSSDGTTKVYQLAETNITSVDFVKVRGVTKTLTTDYTVDLTAGKITFVTAPASGVPDDTDIGWTKGTGQRSLIESCRFAMDYSGQTDSRLFLWCNSTYKNRRFWSGLADGVPSAEYFEANSYDDLGSGEQAITDIVRQYSYQKIFLEDSAMYSYYDTETIGELTTASFPVFDVNDSVGNVAEGQVQLINNNPITLYKGVREWASTTYNLRSETNENLISQRVQDSLDEVDLSAAVTVDWQEMKELWINVGSTVWIYNYFNDTWYKRNNVTATCFLVIDGELYFGTNGTIEKFDTEMRNDNGVNIETIWEMGFWDFGFDYVKKYMSRFWVSLKPNVKCRVSVNAITNNEGVSATQDIYYNLITFKQCDFNHFSFLTSSYPKPFRIRMKEKGFAYLKLRLSGTTLTDVATILSINIDARTGGRV